MPNPILQMLSGGNPRKLNPQMIAQAKQMMSVPGQMQKIKQMIGSGDPKQMFYAACKQYGIDPEDILSELR